ncbi:MAG: hypothetical protein ACYC8T_06965 [Myxococcaceae bacterium]
MIRATTRLTQDRQSNGLANAVSPGFMSDFTGLAPAGRARSPLAGAHRDRAVVAGLPLAI